MEVLLFLMNSGVNIHNGFGWETHGTNWAGEGGGGSFVRVVHCHVLLQFCGGVPLRGTLRAPEICSPCDDFVVLFPHMEHKAALIGKRFFAEVAHVRFVSRVK